MSTNTYEYDARSEQVEEQIFEKVDLYFNISQYDFGIVIGDKVSDSTPVISFGYHV